MLSISVPKFVWVIIMIKNKDDLKYYLLCDKVALGVSEKRLCPIPIIDVIWKFEILMRKCEYYNNRTNDMLTKLLKNIYYIRYKNLSRKLGFSIGLNVFGPGLSIAHYGCIVVNSNARIGRNCRIQEGVTIGTTNGQSEAAVIGDNCFLGSGAKIIGSISLGDNVAVGAGAVVVKSFTENNISLAGVPAKIVSYNGSGSNTVLATDMVSKRIGKK